MAVTVGLVTVEDLVEEIVGEFADERDRPPTLIRLVAPHILECDARAEVVLLEEHYGLPIPEGDYETVAGLHSRPDRNDSRKPALKLNLADAIITVTDADARAIRKVRIRRRLGRFTS